MIAALIRQDPAMRSLRSSIPLALAAGLFIGAVLSNKVGWLEEGFGGVDQGWLIFGFSQVWLALLLFMIVSHITVRCARLSMALPIPTRELWPARMISVGMAGLLPLAVLTLTVSAYSLASQAKPGPITEVLLLGAMMGVGLILAVMLYQTPSPGLSSIRVGWIYILYATAVSCGIPAAILAGRGSLLLPLAMLAASVLLGVHIYLSLPTAFSFTPRGASPAGEIARDGAAEAPGVLSAAAAYVPSRSGDFSGLLHLTAFRVLVNHPLTWILLPIAGFYAYSMVRTYYLGRELQPYLLISLIWLVALLFQGIIRLHKLDHLPISRRLLFAHSVLPLVLVTSAGLGAGQIHFMLDQSQFKMIGYYCRGEKCDRTAVAVPDDCWEIAWDGVAPPVISPWGESHIPKTLHLYRGSGIAVYNPYEVGEASSDDFIEYQLNRAIEKIYGAPALSPRDDPPIGRNAAFQETRPRGEAAVTWPENRGSKSRNKTMAVRVLLFALFTIVIVSLGLQQFRANARRHAYAWLFQGLAAPLLLLLGGLFVADRAGYASFRAFAIFPEVLIRELGELLPLGNMAAWALAIAVLVAGYLVIRSRFTKIEAPIQHKKKLSEY
jgi:hypothetical protein